MIKKIDDLIRFDFTSKCKTCKFKKELNDFEYCCSFVYEQLQKENLNTLKKSIKSDVLNYIFFDDTLEKMDYNNIYFDNDSEYGVVITFKTNLKQDKKLILKELRDSVIKSKYFNNVNFWKDTLYKQEYNEEPQIIE